MRPDIGKQAAEEAIQDLGEKLEGSHMLFLAAGMGGGMLEQVLLLSSLN